MGVQNTLAKKTANNSIVEYESGGQKVKLSPSMIRKYLVSGGGNVTDSEVMMFLSLCKFQRLNPFLREAYLIKYGNNNPATMVVGIDVLLKRARRNPDYRGKKSGIIVQDENGQMIEREGSCYAKGEKIIGGWAKVFIHDYETCEYAAVAFEEYAGRKSNGELNNQWASKPATMIRKVAIAHALREAFPEDVCGMYAAEEIPAAAEVVTDDPAAAEPIIIPEEVAAIPATAETVSEPAENVQDALFG